MEQEMVKKQTNKIAIPIYEMTTTALMAAVMCILGPLSIPIGPVPISLTVVSVLLAAFLIGPKLGTLSYLVYLLLGIFGLPIFSGGTGGLAKVAGPTGGYLLGFIFMALISGIFIEKFMDRWYLVFLGMVLSLVVEYIFGTIWFIYQQKCTLADAMKWCVTPFIPWDLVKIVIVMVVGYQIRKRLVASGVIKK